jgi:disulfide bond formation protein DsbB
VDHALHHPSLAVWISLVLLVLGGVCLAGATRRGRRAAMLALALVVALFGLESAVHSVHHLSDPQAAASCAVLSASQHAPGTCADIPDVGTPTWTAERSPAVGTEIIRPLQAFGPPDGRAPPTLPAV